MQEVPFLPHFVKPLDKAAPKAVLKEKWRAAIGAGSDELEFTGTVNAVIERHGGGEYTLGCAVPEEDVPSGSQTPEGGCLGQPAWVRGHLKLPRASAADPPAPASAATTKSTREYHPRRQPHARRASRPTSSTPRRCCGILKLQMNRRASFSRRALTKESVLLF